jgi:AcrR family transcriptional regulator
MASPAPRPRLRGEANRLEVLRRVTAASERLLAEGESLSTVAIERLAAEAGIARSTFYLHFGDRAALLRRLTDAVMDDLNEAAAPLFALRAEAGFEDVHAAIRAVMEGYRPHELLIGPILAATTHDAEVRAAYEAGITRAADALEAFIVSAPDRRVVDARETAIALVRMVERTVVEEATGASRARRERIARTLAEIAWHALFRDPPPGATLGLRHDRGESS